jgi:hypothetical protein
VNLQQNLAHGLAGTHNSVGIPSIFHSPLSVVFANKSVFLVSVFFDEKILIKHADFREKKEQMTDRSHSEVKLSQHLLTEHPVVVRVWLLLKGSTS